MLDEARKRGQGCWLLLLFPLLGVLLAAVILVSPQRIELPGADAAPIIVDRLAPDFLAQTPNQQTIRLQDLRGKIVAMNFWATWCEPCRSEMPELQNATLRNSGLVVLGIDAGEPAESVQTFMRELGLTFSVLLDPTSDLRNRYGVRVLPTTVWVDAAGIARAKHIGPLTRALIDRYVINLSAQRSTP